MQRNGTIRSECSTTARCVSVLCLACCAVAAFAQPKSQPHLGGGLNRPQQGSNQRPVQRFWQSQPNNVGAGASRGEHLPQWMQQHGNLNTQQQQQALQRESGFHQLPPETQQRMLNRLDHLNSMSPEQRSRVLQRSEQMERLDPQQRSQVRGAMGQLGALPQDRRALVSRSFRALRVLPPQQQNQMLNSPEYHQQFSDEERGTLGNLLAVSPILPRQ